MADVFISYSRNDSRLVDLLCTRVEARGKSLWIDRNEIQPGINWLDDAFAAIAASDSFLFAISPSSVCSPICNKELNYAASLDKKLIPVVVCDTPKSDISESLSPLNWIFCRDHLEVPKAVDDTITAIDTDYDWTRSKTRLHNRALEWQNKKRDRSFLLRGRDLREAEDWLAAATGKKGELPAVLLRYIQHSRIATTRSLQKTIAILGVVILVVAALAFVSYVQYRRALSRQFAAESSNHLNDEIDLALKLAVRANTAADTVEARSAVATALEHNPRIIGVLHPHQGEVRSVAFSPDRRIFASSGTDNTIRLWDLQTRSELGQPLREHTAPVVSLAFSPKEPSILASGAQDAKILLWNIDNHKVVGQLLGHRQAIASIAFSPNADILVSGSYDQTVIVWNLRAGKPICQSPVQNGAVYSVSISEDGLSVAAAVGGGLVIALDPRTCALIGPAMDAHLPGGALAVSYDPSGKALIAGYAYGKLVLWDAQTHEQRSPAVSAHDQGGIRAIGFAGNDGLVLAASEDSTISLWSPTLARRDGAPLLGARSEVLCIAVHPSGSIVASGTRDGTVFLWDLNSTSALGREIAALSTKIHEIALGPPDDGTIVAATEGGTLDLIDLDQRHSQVQLSPKQGVVWSVRFAPNGELFATGYNNGNAMLWNTASKQPTGAPIQTSRGPVYSVAFQPGSNVVCLGVDNGRPVVLDTHQWGTSHLNLTGYKTSFSEVAYSPDGYLLAWADSNNRVVFWNVRDNRPDGTPLDVGGDFVFSIVFSNDGKLVATSSHDGSIRIWDVRNRKLVTAPIFAQKGAVKTLAFSPDDSLLASGGADGHILLWDAKSWQQVGPVLQKHVGMVMSLVFRKNGKQLVSAGEDGRVVAWDVDVAKWLTRASEITRWSEQPAE